MSSIHITGGQLDFPWRTISVELGNITLEKGRNGFLFLISCFSGGRFPFTRFLFFRLYSRRVTPLQ